MSNAEPRDNHIPAFIRKLMPTASEGELGEATENVKRYLAVVLRMYERLKREASEDDSTSLEGDSRIRGDQG